MPVRKVVSVDRKQAEKLLVDCAQELVSEVARSANSYWKIRTLASSALGWKQIAKPAGLIIARQLTEPDELHSRIQHIAALPFVMEELKKCGVAAAQLENHTAVESASSGIASDFVAAVQLNATFDAALKSIEKAANLKLQEAYDAITSPDR